MIPTASEDCIRGLHMIEIRPWMKREFNFDQPIDVFPVLLERLRGTAARAKELIAGVSDEVLATCPDGKWSVKDHLGHLVDLQPLDEQRLHEFLSRVLQYYRRPISAIVPPSVGITARRRARTFSDGCALVAKN